MKSFMFIPLLIAFASAFALPQHLGAQIAVPNSVLSNGGDVLSGSSYRVIGTIGQPFSGVAQNPSNVNSAGFWYLPKPMLITDVEQISGAVPTEYRLEQNYPNPFNPETVIRFQLPIAGHVAIKIFNILGREIRTLANANYEAGYHRVHWDGKDKNGKPVASGVYFYQLQAGSFSQVRKMSLLR